MSNNTIWQYWEGETIPPYYALCQETVARHNDNVRVIGPDDLPELIGPIPEILKKSYITHRVDWIRKKLLVEQGGVYVDSDFICVRSMAPLQALSLHYDFAGYKEHNSGMWMDNLVCGRKGSKILQSAADYAQRVLEEKEGRVNWLEASCDAVEHGFREFIWKEDWMKIPTHLIEPQKVVDNSWFTDHTDTAPDHNCYGFMTSVHSLGEWTKNKNREELLTGKSRVCHIFRRAMA